MILMEDLMKAYLSPDNLLTFLGFVFFATMVVTSLYFLIDDNEVDSH